MRSAVDVIRSWAYSWFGIACAGILLLVVLIPPFIVTAFMLREDRAQMAISAGIWWLAGIALIHVILPVADSTRTVREPLGSALWHASLTLVATLPVAWIVIVGSGRPLAYTLADVLMVGAYWAVFTMVVGVAMIWFRGYSVDRTLRYTMLSASVAVVWTTIWMLLDATIFASG